MANFKAVGIIPREYQWHKKKETIQIGQTLCLGWSLPL